MLRHAAAAAFPQLERPKAAATVAAQATTSAAARASYFPLLDAMRAVAALMVVVFHAHMLFGVLWHESFLAVDIFFVLSGVVIANAYEASLQTTMSFPRFALIRIARLYPLYLVSVLISIAYLLANQLMPHRAIDVATLVLTGLLILPTRGATNAFPLNPPTWSLFFELLINAVYALAVRKLSDRVIVAIMAASGLAIAGFSLHHSLDAGWTWKSLPFGALRVTYSFFAGVLIFRAYHGRPAREMGPATAWLASLAILVLTFAALAIAPTPRLTGVYGVAAIIAIFPLLVYAAVAVRVSAAASKVFAFFGVLSYSIYVLHEPLRNIVLSGGTASPAHLLPTPIAGVAFVVLLCVLGYVLDRVYDTPLRRLLTKRARAR